jgi:hypothetical protein
MSFKSIWSTSDVQDRHMLASLLIGVVVTIGVWWALIGRSKYSGKGMR